jgi:hypothetical protein
VIVLKDIVLEFLVLGESHSMSVLLPLIQLIDISCTVVIVEHKISHVKSVEIKDLHFLLHAILLIHGLDLFGEYLEHLHHILSGEDHEHAVFGDVCLRYLALDLHGRVRFKVSESESDQVDIKDHKEGLVLAALFQVILSNHSLL